MVRPVEPLAGLSDQGSPRVGDPGTDHELSDLLTAIRRHVLEVPPGTWESDVQDAARRLTSAIAAHLDPGQRDG